MVGTVLVELWLNPNSMEGEMIGKLCLEKRCISYELKLLKARLLRR
jgi:hypothetical protein